jgi:DNA-binding NtrC family response regulator
LNDAAGKIYRILVVDDDRNLLKTVQFALSRAPEFKCEVVTASNADRAKKKLEKQHFDLVLSDYMMPGMNGIGLLLFVKDKYPKTARMILTAYADIDVILKAVENAGVHGFVEKPWGKGALTSAVDKVLKEVVG